ncbi:hypothetical protein GCM10027037_16230 [Mucilaginibacter koreensis]
MTDLKIKYKIDFYLLFKNNLLLTVILIVVGMFFRITWIERFVIVCVIMMTVCVKIAFSKKMISIVFDEEYSQISIILSGIFVTKKMLNLHFNEVKYYYAEEIVGRGIKSLVLALYKMDDEIIKLKPSSSGFSQDTIAEIEHNLKIIGARKI